MLCLWFRGPYFSKDRIERPITVLSDYIQAPSQQSQPFRSASGVLVRLRNASPNSFVRAARTRRNQRNSPRNTASTVSNKDGCRHCAQRARIAGDPPTSNRQTRTAPARRRQRSARVSEHWRVYEGPLRRLGYSVNSRSAHRKLNSPTPPKSKRTNYSLGEACSNSHPTSMGTRPFSPRTKDSI
jgi:hypothetical protein